MENSIYVGLSKLIVLEENMRIVSNNVANMNTTGFRGQNMVFTEHISDPRGQKEPISMVLDYGQYQVTDPGPLTITDNPFDLALVGPGWFGVQTANGVQYTRSGNFSLNANGELVTQRGLPVVDEGSAPIIIPEGVVDVGVDRSGVISSEEGEIAKLMLVEFDNTQTLNPAGNGMYETDAAAQEASQTTVLQGSVEGSNVQPVLEMTRMIEVLRKYQAVQRLVQTEHERMRTAVQRIAGESR